MAKIDLKEEYQSVVNKIYKNGFSGFEKYLRFCGRGNVYEFDNYRKSLIYAQKPNASFLATYEDWSEKEMRFPKKNSCIYVSGSASSLTMEHYFDFSDTFATRHTNKSHAPFRFTKDAYEYLIKNNNGKTINDIISSLTRTNVRGTLKLENWKEFNSDEITNFILECSNLIVTTRCNQNYEINMQAKKFYDAIPVRSYAAFYKDFGNAITEVSQNSLKLIFVQMAAFKQERERQLEKERSVRYERRNYEPGRNNAGRRISKTSENEQERSRRISGNPRGETSNVERKNNSENGTLRNGANGLDGGELSVGSGISVFPGTDASIRGNESGSVQGTDVSAEQGLSHEKLQEEHDISGERTTSLSGSYDGRRNSIEGSAADSSGKIGFDSLIGEDFFQSGLFQSTDVEEKTQIKKDFTDEMIHSAFLMLPRGIKRSVLDIYETNTVSLDFKSKLKDKFGTDSIFLEDADNSFLFKTDKNGIYLFMNGEDADYESGFSWDLAGELFSALIKDGDFKEERGIIDEFNEDLWIEPLKSVLLCLPDEIKTCLCNVVNYGKEKYVAAALDMYFKSSKEDLIALNGENGFENIIFNEVKPGSEDDWCLEIVAENENSCIRLNGNDIYTILRILVTSGQIVPKSVFEELNFSEEPFTVPGRDYGSFNQLCKGIVLDGKKHSPWKPIVSEFIDSQILSSNIGSYIADIFKTDGNKNTKVQFLEDIFNNKNGQSVSFSKYSNKSWEDGVECSLEKKGIACTYFDNEHYFVGETITWNQLYDEFLSLAEQRTGDNSKVVVKWIEPIYNAYKQDLDNHSERMVQLRQADHLVLNKLFTDSKEVSIYNDTFQTILDLKTTNADFHYFVEETFKKFISETFEFDNVKFSNKNGKYMIEYVPSDYVEESVSSIVSRDISLDDLCDSCVRVYQNKELFGKPENQIFKPGYREFVGYFMDRYIRKKDYKESFDKYLKALDLQTTNNNRSALEKENTLLNAADGKQEEIGRFQVSTDNNGFVNLKDIKTDKEYSGSDAYDYIESQKKVSDSDFHKDKKSVLQQENAPVKSGVPVNFSYDDTWTPNVGGDKERFNKNIDAIKTLKKVEKENRYASSDEQKILSQYIGWGGLSNAFDSSKDNWSKEYTELKEVLTPEEYVAARSTVNDAFYTPKNVIDNIYKALEKMGFSGGNVLEPSMGVGNFFSGMPQNMRENSRLYGVEIDSISGRIAKLLHPDATIQICGFENSNLSENMFDVVIGNVPFGQIHVNDKKYRKENYLIHDYFFMKSLDKVAVGGIVALITSKGTLDKANGKFRRTISERAELVGAIRLPNTTFLDSANTEVTSDILFFKKKSVPGLDRDEPSWLTINVENDDMNNKVPYNQYFVDHPRMMLGEMFLDTRMFGENSNYTGLKPFPDKNINELLEQAVHQLPEDIIDVAEPEILDNNDVEIVSIPAVPWVKNNTFAVVDGEVYFRENSSMSSLAALKIDSKQEDKIKAFCNLKKQVHKLIDLQLEDCSDDVLKTEQFVLNQVYDSFLKKYGNVVERKNEKVLLEDVDYPLVSSLENRDENGLISKADIFIKRTICPSVKPTKAANAQEALSFSMNEYGSVSIPYMMSLYPVSMETMIEELGNSIFMNPVKMREDDPYRGWESAEEYLSGNVKIKLVIAEKFAKADAKFNKNVEALESVQPVDLEPQEIYVRIGTTWIDKEDYEDFLYETLKMADYRKSRYSSNCIEVKYEKRSNTYSITNKTSINYNSANTDRYGTSRMPAVYIFENLLNQRDIKVRDRIDHEDGSYHYELNSKETMLAQEKSTILNEKFKDWIFENSERREKYVKYYNDTFNNYVLREYDGSSMTFPGMNPDVKLKAHQVNAVARIVRSGNTLLGHCVGAGKSFEIAAGAMELRRTGLAHKPLIVVPNGLTGQMASEFMRLYPSAEILMTTKKDFEKKNRKRFISKIATGDYDAVIMGHSQLEKIPISIERKRAYMQNEIEEITEAIDRLKYQSGEKWSVKMMERERKSMEEKLQALDREDYKDKMLTFEELGVDALFIDEAHNYKNLSFVTKMGRVSGINPNGSMKCMDLFLKIQYLNELNPGKNIVFATGTPISNTMGEMYTMMKYLEPKRLKETGMYHFDSWAANFGETVTQMELAPEGNKYRQKTSFSKFVNLPELITMFKNVADIVTSDMVDLKTPNLVDDKYQMVVSKPNGEVKAMMDSFVERAERIHNGSVKPDEDNMLKVCHDAKLLGTDIRLLDPEASNDPSSKLNKCVDKLFSIWNDTKEEKLVQAVMCDIGIPKDKDTFDVYNYLKDELIEKGVPAEEICFIHDAKNETQRALMQEQLRKGIKRIVVGSTTKMGTGTNIQDKLIALHELDVPWRPSDVEQREGRIIRQCNSNDNVYIFRYVTEGTFDAYNWGIIEKKQGFIGRVMTSKTVARTCDDIDEMQISAAEAKAIASGDTRIKERSDCEMELKKLSVLKSEYKKHRYDLDRKVTKMYPEQLERLEKKKLSLEKDIALRNSNLPANKDKFKIEIDGTIFDNAEKAGEAIMKLAGSVHAGDGKIKLGSYLGFQIYASKDYSYSVAELTQKNIHILGDSEHIYEMSDSAMGNISRLRNAMKKFDENHEHIVENIEEVQKNIIVAKEEFAKPFDKDERIEYLSKRITQLDHELSGDDDKKEEEKTKTNSKVH